MDNTEDLYKKYMSFNQILLEDHDPLEVAAILTVQGLTFYRSIMNEEDYLKMVDSIYENRFNVKTIDGPIIQ